MTTEPLRISETAGFGQGTDMRASLQELNDRLDSISEVIDSLRPILALMQQAPPLAAMLGDSFDDVMRTARDHGIDVEQGLLNGAGAALRFGAAMDVEKVRALEALLQSGVLDPGALRIIGGPHGPAQGARRPRRAAGARLPRQPCSALREPFARAAAGAVTPGRERTVQPHHEVLIIGGGTAGLTVASQLAARIGGAAIAVVEPSAKHYYRRRRSIPSSARSTPPGPARSPTTTWSSPWASSSGGRRSPASPSRSAGR